MASEDSDQLVPGFPSVHRLHDFDYLRKTSMGLVTTFRHELDTRSELLEVEPFGSTKWMLPEEWDDPFKQILSTTNDEAVEVFPVVVMPPVDVHLARSEELTEIVETRDAAYALSHDEIM
jgi:hypothetical protein